MGREGINTLLVASQVVLSMALPFITLPLILLTSNKRIMSVRKPSRNEATMCSSAAILLDATGSDLENADEWVDFSNSKLTSAVGLIIWLVIVAANVYVLVKLGSP